MFPYPWLAMAVVVVAAAPSALAQTATGDPVAGEKVFNQCKGCHTVEEGKNRIGPSLYGVVGRKAGSIDGFNYSPAMKSAGLTWTVETLDKYLADPKAVVPGNKMAFAGLKNEQDRQNVIAYLGQHGKK
jgi:cytochrome c